MGVLCKNASVCCWWMFMCFYIWWMFIRLREGIGAKFLYFWSSCPLTHSSSVCSLIHDCLQNPSFLSHPPSSVRPCSSLWKPNPLCEWAPLTLMLRWNFSTESYRVKQDLLWMSSLFPLLITFIYPGKVDWALCCYTFTLFNTQTRTSSALGVRSSTGFLMKPVKLLTAKIGSLVVSAK